MGEKTLRKGAMLSESLGTTVVENACICIYLFVCYLSECGAK